MHIHILLLLVSLIWGSSFVATEIVLKEVSVLTLLILRLGLASILFFAILLLRKDWKAKIKPSDLLYFLLIGLLSVSVYQLLQISANKLSNASITSVFITLHPITLALFGIVIFKEQKHLAKIAGITIGFCGSLIIASNGKWTLDQNTNYSLALFCSVLNSLMWAGYSTLAKKVSSKYASLDITALMTILGFLCFLPFTPFLGNLFQANPVREVAKLSFGSWVALFYLAIVCTIIGYVLWLYCLKKIEISKAGYYLYLEPIFTIAIAPFFVSNQLTIYLVIGGIFIFSGLLSINLKPLNRQAVRS